MSRALRGLGKRAWPVLALLAASAAAQDVRVPSNPYALSKDKRAPEAPAKVDPSMRRALEDKLAACYEREQGQALSGEDKKLLGEFGAELVRELAPGFASTSCKADQPASANCRDQLAALPCETLAEPIVAAGWDRNLTPAQRAQVAEYATALAQREATCAGREADESEIVRGIRVDQLTVLIEAQIVSGRCELVPEQQSACSAQLPGVACSELVDRNERGELIQLCGELLRCTDATGSPAQ